MPSSQVIYGHAGGVVRAAWRGNTHTLLRHLREDRGLTGTKEGCAEGDCGACMVLLGDFDHADPTRIGYRIANACLLPFSAVHGRLLITIEDLGTAETLHPVQQAMVEEHASQCGFCTPGFVVSLYELYLRQAQVMPLESIHCQLSGNLCRCTGYASILRAAQRMHALPRVIRNADADAALLAELQAATEQAGQHLRNDMDVAYLPSHADEVANTLQEIPEARLLGGSTDASLWLNKRLDHPRHVIHLHRAADLQRIQRDQHGLRLGAATPLTDAFSALLLDYPELDEYLERFASPAVRHWATLGGNIANGSPIGDSMPLLMALGAGLVLRCGDSERVLALEDFYLGYQRTALRKSEFVAAVCIPPRAPNRFVRAYKVSKRCDDDISAVSLVLDLRIEAGSVVEARVALGGMAETPRRAGHTEKALTTGLSFDSTLLPALGEALSKDFSPLSDHRASAAYRRQVAVNLLHRAMLEHLGEAEPRVQRIHQGETI